MDIHNEIQTFFISGSTPLVVVSRLLLGLYVWLNYATINQLRYPEPKKNWSHWMHLLGHGKEVYHISLYYVVQFNHLHCSISGTGVRVCQLRPRSRHKADGLHGGQSPDPRLGNPARPAWINHGWAAERPLGRSTKHKRASMVPMEDNTRGTAGQNAAPERVFYLWVSRSCISGGRCRGRGG